MKFVRNLSSIKKLVFDLGWSLILVGVCTCLQFLLWPFIKPLAFLFFYPLVLLSGWVRGTRSGILTTLGGGIAVWYWFMPPYASLKFHSFHSTSQLAFFWLIGILLSILTGSLKKAQDKQRQTESEAKRSKDEIELLFMQAPILISTHYGELQTFEIANNLVHSFLEKNPMGLPLREALAGKVFPEDIERMRRALDQVQKTGEILFEREKKARIHAGKGEWEDRYFNLFIQPIKTFSPSTLGVIVYIIDVTEQVLNRKKIQETLDLLKQSEERLRVVSNSVKVGTWELDMATQEITRSEHHDSLYGHIPNLPKWTLNDFFMVLHPEDKASIMQSFEDAMSQGKEEYAGEFRILWPDGSVHWLTSRAIFIFNEENGERKIKLVRGALIDVTHLKETEERLENALRTRDEFLSIVSHELKTPLTSLKLQLQMVQRSVRPNENLLPPPVKLARSLDISLKQVDRLTSLIEDLLDISRIRSGKLSFNFEWVNLSKVIEETLERLSTTLVQAKCPIQTDLEQNRMVFCDRVRIEQVFVNLLSNAIKYAPGERIQIRLKAQDDRIALIVQDFGPGIEKDKQQKIFDRFERINTSTEISGLGLGLYIVSEIVKAHHGSITLESDVGQGATFNIILWRDFRLTF